MLSAIEFVEMLASEGGISDWSFDCLLLLVEFLF